MYNFTTKQIKNVRNNWKTQGIYLTKAQAIDFLISIKGV